MCLCEAFTWTIGTKKIYLFYLILVINDTNSFDSLTNVWPKSNNMRISEDLFYFSVFPFFLLRHFNGSCDDLYPLLCCVLLMSLTLHWSFKSHNIEYRCVISMYMFNLYCSHNMHNKIIAENIQVIFPKALMGLDTLICR